MLIADFFSSMIQNGIQPTQIGIPTRKGASAQELPEREARDAAPPAIRPSVARREISCLSLLLLSWKWRFKLFASALTFRRRSIDFALRGGCILDAHPDFTKVTQESRLKLDILVLFAGRVHLMDAVYSAGTRCENHDPIAEIDRLLDVVGDEDDGHPLDFVHMEQKILHALPVCASSAANGSSMRRIGGFCRSARAIATRCCIPPEVVLDMHRRKARGQRAASVPGCARRRSSRGSDQMRERLAERREEKAMFWATVSHGNRL